ncbi:MAG TPA: hypothetical protein VJQ82_04685, partial [Terriglobales bacterium]|nr:hypothetical protein [Terriglobales bacterium]
DFREMARDENLAIDFYRVADTADLAHRLAVLLESPEQQRLMAEQNFSVALRMTMPQIIHQYLRHFDRERRTVALRRLARLRTWPRWIPWKFLVGRTMGTGSHWSDRPAFAPLNNGYALQKPGTSLSVNSETAKGDEVARV